MRESTQPTRVGFFENNWQTSFNAAVKKIDRETQAVGKKFNDSFNAIPADKKQSPLIQKTFEDLTTLYNFMEYQKNNLSEQIKTYIALFNLERKPNGLGKKFDQIPLSKLLNELIGTLELFEKSLTDGLKTIDKLEELEEDELSHFTAQASALSLFESRSSDGSVGPNTSPTNTPANPKNEIIAPHSSRCASPAPQA